MTEDNFYVQQPQISALTEAMQIVRDEIANVIIGQQQLIELLLTGLLCDGHILIEGVPGVAKTLTAKLIARIIDVEFSRLQFTPDMMPSDVIGTSVFNPGEGAFRFKPGPVFSNIVLIDEINRAPAKTQSALFEVMEERQVTVDGQTHIMNYPFIVLATQNPIEQEGTYRLPEAQLDRFIFKLNVDYPTLQEEVMILQSQQGESQSEILGKVKKTMSSRQLLQYRQIVSAVKVEHKILEFIASIVTGTRNAASLFLGASPRASLALLRAAKAAAALAGRDFVIPEDVIKLVPHVLRHRIVLTAEKEMEGVTEDDVIEILLKSVEVPR